MYFLFVVSYIEMNIEHMTILGSQIAIKTIERYFTETGLMILLIVVVKRAEAVSRVSGLESPIEPGAKYMRQRQNTRRNERDGNRNGNGIRLRDEMRVKERCRYKKYPAKRFPNPISPTPISRPRICVFGSESGHLGSTGKSFFSHF
jgi:hypothetical protein